ncbi:MAG: GAF domain-containing protein [Desulfovibrio sp.]|uniref:GAF domain-containing protein n=1 Tax=Desulfovibrio sp. TaxID=885 RepID=UPI001A701190|nr:GAF domain-containing protein [Desulfovibrio sp.]MBD5417738.1 GAF domain-containing protein [Desulfovibrio sp.]
MNATSLEQQVLCIICSVFDAHSAVLFLPEEIDDACRLSAAFSLGDSIHEDAVIRPGAGLVGWIIRNRQPLLLPHFDQRPSNLGYYEDGAETGIKAFMGCPVPTGGVLCVDSKRQYSFSDKDAKLLQLFAELIARLETNLPGDDLAGDIPRYFAELGVIQDLRFRYRRWPVFLENFLLTMRDATGFEYCAFASLDPGGDHYCVEAESRPLLLKDGAPACRPLGAGLVGWAFRDEQPVFVDDEAAAAPTALFGKVEGAPEFRTAICMPVMVHKTARGVLCLARTGAGSIDEGLRSFVRQAVDHLGLFLENLYLRTRLKALLPKATVESDGGRVFDPDLAPAPPREER